MKQGTLFFVLIIFGFNGATLNTAAAQDNRNRMQPVLARTPNAQYSVDDRIDRGIELYEQGNFSEAMRELRQAEREASLPEDRAESLFWIAITEISGGDYENAFYDLDSIRRVDPANIRVLEVPYHKARALFYLRRYNEAINSFQEYERSIRIDGRYMNSIRYDNYPTSASFDTLQIDYNKKASALYWIAECYYMMEDYESALGFYNIIIEQYMKSHKYESSINRVALIRQKKVENDLREELKALLKPQDPPVAAAPQPETQTGGPSYDEAILAYQNRIAPYLMMRAMGEDQKPKQPEPAVLPQTPQSLPQPKNTDHDVTKRLLSIKTGALSIMDRLISTLNAYEIIETQRW